MLSLWDFWLTKARDQTFEATGRNYKDTILFNSEVKHKLHLLQLPFIYSLQVNFKKNITAFIQTLYKL